MSLEYNFFQGFLYQDIFFQGVNFHSYLFWGGRLKTFFRYHFFIISKIKFQGFMSETIILSRSYWFLNLIIHTPVWIKNGMAHCDVEASFELKTEGREVWRKHNSLNDHWTYHKNIIEEQNIYSFEIIC